MKNIKDYILNENNFFKNLGVGQQTLIKKWLDKYNIKNYTINDDLTIDVNGNVNLRGYKEKELPEYIQFNKVTSYFEISGSNIETLRGCPRECDVFECYGCVYLKNLKYAPIKCYSQFNCGGCTQLKNLINSPSCETLYCHNCINLKSLKGLSTDVKLLSWCVESKVDLSEIKHKCTVVLTDSDLRVLCNASEQIDFEMRL